MAWDSRHSSGRTRNARVGVLSSTGHAATAAAAAASTRAQAEQAAALVEIIRTKYRRDEVRVWRRMADDHAAFADSETALGLPRGDVSSYRARARLWYQVAEDLEAQAEVTP